jgi:ABC-type amino acid transport substrate-binding protein
MLRCFFPCLALLLFVLRGSALGGADENRTVSIAAFEYPPIYQIGPDKGVSCDLALAAFRAAGVKARISFYPVRRMVAMVANGGVVCGLGGQVLFSGPESVGRVTVAETLQYVRQTFFYDLRRHPGGLDYARLDDFQPFSIGVLGGSGIMRILEQEADLRLSLNTTHEGSARQLQAGRIDLWAVVDITGLKHLRELFGEEADHFKDTRAFNLGDVSIAFSDTRDPDHRYADLFRRGLAAIKKNGEYRRIMSRYYGPALTSESLTPDMR